MSGFSSDEICPNCNNTCDLYTDHKPFSYSSIQCCHCGFQMMPEITYMNLDELNDYRAQIELEPLEVLPEQTFEF